MEPEEASCVIRKIAPRVSDTQANHLAWELERRPLVLAQCASYLAANPEEDIDDFLRSLSRRRALTLHSVALEGEQKLETLYQAMLDDLHESQSLAALLLEYLAAFLPLLVYEPNTTLVYLMMRLGLDVDEVSVAYRTYLAGLKILDRRCLLDQYLEVPALTGDVLRGILGDRLLKIRQDCLEALAAVEPLCLIVRTPETEHWYARHRRPVSDENTQLKRLASAVYMFLAKRPSAPRTRY